MKENYEGLNLEVIRFRTEDIITTSQEQTNPPQDPTGREPVEEDYGTTTK